MRIMLAIAVLLAGVLGTEARSSRVGGGGYGVWVRGYVRSNGTYVQPYHRARPGLGAAYGYRSPIAAGWSSSGYPSHAPLSAPASNSTSPAGASVSVPASGSDAEPQPIAPNYGRDPADEDAGPARCDDGIPVGINGTLCMLN